MKRKRWSFVAKESDSDDDESESVSSVNNHIYFYCDVNRENVLKLQKLLMQESKRYDKLVLHIHSDGGCAFSGLAAMDFISTFDVCTVAEGVCASAATFMLLAGTQRKMTTHSLLLIHEVSSLVGWSKFTELQTELQNNELMMTMIIGIYADKSKLKRKELRKMLKDDKYIDSKMALEYGLIDSIEV